MTTKIVVRCNELGFDCNYAVTGDFEKVVFDYWDHMNMAHGIEYSPETLAKYVIKKIPTKILAS